MNEVCYEKPDACIRRGRCVFVFKTAAKQTPSCLRLGASGCHPESESTPEPEPILLKGKILVINRQIILHNEGTDPHWAYMPPPGAMLADHDVDAGEFEWSNVKRRRGLGALAYSRS